MQGRDQRHQIARGLVKSAVLGSQGRKMGKPHDGEDQAVAGLVGQYIEVQAEGPLFAAIVQPIAGFHEAPAEMRVLPVDPGDDLQLAPMRLEVPGDGRPQVVFPDVQDPANRAKGVRRPEGSVVLIDVIEMTLRIRFGLAAAGPPDRAADRRFRSASCRPHRPRTCASPPGRDEASPAARKPTRSRVS